MWKKYLRSRGKAPFVYYVSIFLGFLAHVSMFLVVKRIETAFETMKLFYKNLLIIQKENI